MVAALPQNWSPQAPHDLLFFVHKRIKNGRPFFSGNQVLAADHVDRWGERGRRRSGVQGTKQEQRRKEERERPGREGEKEEGREEEVGFGGDSFADSMFPCPSLDSLPASLPDVHFLALTSLSARDNNKHVQLLQELLHERSEELRHTCC